MQAFERLAGYLALSILAQASCAAESVPEQGRILAPTAVGEHEFASLKLVSCKGSKGNARGISTVDCKNRSCDCLRLNNNCQGSWFENTVAFTGVDAYKSLGDYFPAPLPVAGYMNSAGILTGLNSGVGLGCSRIRGQIGGSCGVYDLKGRDFVVNPQTPETQFFLTVGFSKRSNYRSDDWLTWGLVYDQFWADQFGTNADEIYLGQVRTSTGIAVNACNEVGVWATLHTTLDSIATGRIRASNQANLYWKHNYDLGGTCMLYAGGVDSADAGSWTAGLQGLAPLSNYSSLFANSTFQFPGSATGPIGSNELSWNLSMGFMFSFGGKARSQNISGQSGLPLLQVANNGNFLITN